MSARDIEAIPRTVSPEIFVGKLYRGIYGSGRFAAEKSDKVSGTVSDKGLKTALWDQLHWWGISEFNSKLKLLTSMQLFPTMSTYAKTCEQRIDNMNKSERFVAQKKFSRWLAKLMKSHGYSAKDIQDRLAISRAAVSYYLTDKRNPTQRSAREMADKLELSSDERKELWEALGLVDKDAVKNRLDSIANNHKIAVLDRQRLFESVQQVIDVWEAEAKHQIKRVKAAIIPLAGWQKQLLSPEWTVHYAANGVEEAKLAAIHHIVFVVGAEQKKMLEATRNYDRLKGQAEKSEPKVKFQFAIQEEMRNGPGYAVLAGSKCLRMDEPVCVIFPDEALRKPKKENPKDKKSVFENQAETKLWLAAMIMQYETSGHSVIAMHPLEEPRRPVEELQREDKSRGVAFVKGTRKTEEGHVLSIAACEENPEYTQKEGFVSYEIFGRFILTPDCLRRLADRAEMTLKDGKRLFLTSALDSLAKTGPHSLEGVHVGGRISVGDSRNKMDEALKGFSSRWGQELGLTESWFSVSKTSN